LNALKKLSIRYIQTANNKLTREHENPFKENPTIVRAIVEAGGRIQSVSVLGKTLEDAYLRLVRVD
jgi:hypothetical protein